MYENYGGTRPEIPDKWEEVGYRAPKMGEDYISPITGQLVKRGIADFDRESVIVRRKPKMTIVEAHSLPIGTRIRRPSKPMWIVTVGLDNTCYHREDILADDWEVVP